MKITRAIVESARARAVADPAILIAGQMAVNSRGDRCLTTDPDAQCFCTLGLVANEAGFAAGDLGATKSYYDIATELFGDPDREVRINQVIDLTDGGNNRLDITPKCPTTYPAGLAGFDYLLTTNLPE